MDSDRLNSPSPLPSLKCPYENCKNPDWLSEEMLYKHMLMHHEAGEGLKILTKIIVKLTEEKERLEHSEMEKVVSLSSIMKHIEYVERGNSVLGENDYRHGAMAALKDIKKEAKAAEPAALIQSLKAMLGHEYYK